MPLHNLTTLKTEPPKHQTKMKRRFLFVVFVAAIAAAPVPAAEPVDFAHEIVPILRQHCGNCHTGDKKEGGYSMNTRASLLAGGESGAAATSGKSESSELIRRIRSRDKDEQMPPEGPRLTEKEIDLLK